MDTFSLPVFVVFTLSLSAVAFITLAWVLWLQAPSLPVVFRRYGRLIWAKKERRKRVLNDSGTLDRRAKNIEGDVLYFD